MVLRSMSLPQCNATHANFAAAIFTNACAHFIECNGRSPVLGSESPKRSWRPICRAPGVRKKLSFKARERVSMFRILGAEYVQIAPVF